MFNKTTKLTAILMVICMLITSTSFADANKVPLNTAINTLGTTSEFVGTILEITNKQILVQSTISTQGHDKILFNLSRDTKFEGLHLTELSVGDRIVVNHGLAMTRSLPPQTLALVVKSGTSLEQTFNYEGIIKELIKDSNNNWLILVETQNNKEINKQIRFVVSGNTKLVNVNLADLKVGNKVKLTYGMAMTMSIPPQTAALSLTLVKETPKLSEIEGRITAVIKVEDNLLITVRTHGQKGGSKEMLFLVTAKTKFEDGKLKDLKVKETVEIKYQANANPNLPQVYTALVIEFDED